MPRASAEELFASVGPDGGNVLLPGIFSGVEPLVVAERLASHQAVFAWDASPELVKLALTLHEFSPPLRAGRIVLLCGGELEETLEGFFAQNPGYEFPTRLLTMPQCSIAQIGEWQRRLVACATRVSVKQMELAAEVRERLRDAFATDARGRAWPGDRSPRIVVMGSDNSANTAAHAPRIQSALQSLGWPHKVSMVDAPNKCHLVARLGDVEAASPDLALWVDGVPGAIRAMLPDALPVAAWFFPGTDVPRSGTIACGPFDVFVATTAKQQADLALLGVPLDRITRRPPAFDATLFHRPPVRQSPQPDPSPTVGAASWGQARAGAPPIGVIVAADLPDDSPEAANVNLPSHLALWKAMREAVAAAADDGTEAAPERCFDAAERSSGTSLRDAAIRKVFLRFLGERIAPAVVARETVSTLKRTGCRVGVYGSHWNLDDVECDLLSRELPQDAQRAELFRTVEWVVLPMASPTALELALEALACGAKVALRAGRVPISEEHPALAAVAPAIHVYGRLAELRRLVLGNRGGGARDGGAGRTTEVIHGALVSEHSVTARIRSIVAEITCGRGAGVTESAACGRF
ncbi:MAG: hypothetical protein AABZ12_15130 [Planctomycetota bacterium]